MGKRAGATAEREATEIICELKMVKAPKGNGGYRFDATEDAATAADGRPLLTTVYLHGAAVTSLDVSSEGDVIEGVFRKKQA